MMRIQWPDVFDDQPYAGPYYEPNMHHDGFPDYAQPGDIYKNGKYSLNGEEPRYYLNTGKGTWVPIEAEELNKWVRSGKMRYPTPVPATNRASPTLGTPSLSGFVSQ